MLLLTANDGEGEGEGEIEEKREARHWRRKDERPRRRRTSLAAV